MTASPASLLEHLRVSKAEGCSRCSLHRGRNRLVFGVGNPEAAIVLVGEAPGEDENRQGEPFVGQAGQWLNSLLRRAGLTREEIYLLNTVKCHPPSNRVPSEDEIHACSPFLHLQVAIIRPRVLVAVGGVPGRYLTREGPDATLGFLRSRDWVYRNEISGFSCPLIVTYHPSYVLRNKDNPAVAKDAALKVLSDFDRAIRVAKGL